LRRSLSVAWAHVANPVRDVAVPRSARVIGVGGPTLGGSYKTPCVLAFARSLAKRGQAVVVAAHGYRAGVRAPRRVVPSDDVRDVGDDALWLSRELDELGVPVVVGRHWDATVALAATKAATVIVDGLLQASPDRLAWSVLVVDGSRPWGSEHCPPAGDLRAPPAVLIGASDATVEVVDGSVMSAQSPASDPAVLPAESRTAFRVTSDIVSLRSPGSRTLSLEEAARCRVGLLAAVARPERIVTSLVSRGIRPVETRVFGDHRALPERRVRPRTAVDLWITTGKCATKLGPYYEEKPVWALEHRLTLPDELVDRAAQN
jgi:tetraacyldisaccharide 4'-kinase